MEQTPKYYKIDSFECGPINTGSRSTTYFCHLEVYDENMMVVKHSISDRYTGKWPKCQSLINRWIKIAKKEKLERVV